MTRRQKNIQKVFNRHRGRFLRILGESMKISHPFTSLLIGEITKKEANRQFKQQMKLEKERLKLIYLMRKELMLLESKKGSS